MLEFLLFLGVVVGGGGYAFWDYKQGFSTTKNLARRAVALIKEEDPVALVERDLEEKAKSIARTQEALASAQASRETTQKKLEEEQRIAQRYEKAAILALKTGNEDTAQAAVSGKVEAEKRIKLYNGFIEECNDLEEGLLTELAYQETSLDILQTTAESVRANAVLNQTRKENYALISAVNPSTGFSNNERLRRSLQKAELDNTKSKHLLRLAQNNPRHKRDQFMQAADVQDELERLQNRLALPSATEPDQVAGELEAGQAEVAEPSTVASDGSIDITSTTTSVEDEVPKAATGGSGCPSW